MSLTCSLCDLPYDTVKRLPKLLSCHHGYCLPCLQQLAVGRTAFRCPDESCRKKTHVPEYGVEHLRDNFYIEQLQTAITPPVGPHAPRDASTATCHKHMQQPLLFYCSTCMAAICMNCTVLDHDKNNGHHITDIATVVNTNNTILRKKLHNVELRLATYHNNLHTLKAEITNLETVKLTSVNQIEETFKQLHEKLNQRAALLKENVEQYYQDQKEHIISQVQDVKHGTAELTKCKLDIESGLDKGGIGNALELAKTVQNLDIVDKLCENSERTPEYRNGYIKFKYDYGLDNYLKTLKHLGKIECDSKLPSNVKTLIPDFVAAIQSTVTIKSSDGSGQKVENYPLTTKISNDSTGESYTITPKFLDKGHHTFDFKPKFCGEHKLQLFFCAKPIWGSEKTFTVRSNDPVLTVQGSDSTEPLKPALFHPTSVAVNSDGAIYVADMGNKKVHMFDRTGNSTGAFSLGGSESTTYDIAINHATEEILCTKIGPNDTGQTIGNTIRIFGLDGRKKKQFSNKAMKRAMFLDVNSKGQVIVTDSAQNAVYIYSKEGIPVKQFGSIGTKHGQFNFPTAIAVGRDDVIIIADTKNNRIQIFNKHGKFLSAIGPSVGDCNHCTEIQAPRGVTADSSHILIADSLNRILIVSYTGNLQGCIGSEGDSICEPYNLAVTGDQHVLVADFKNNAIKKYKFE